jgi:hypothetical protein
MSYQIIEWDKHYENNRSRQVERLHWVSVPNRHDGEGYSLIMADTRAAEIFAAWILIVQVASKCHPRGSLVRDDGTPMSLRAISLKTRGDLKWFEYAIPKLLEVGWIQPLTTECHLGAPRRQVTDANLTPPCEEGREENGKKEENSLTPSGRKKGIPDSVLHAFTQIGRKKTTAWTDKELTAYRKLKLTEEDAVRDIALFAKAREAGWGYHRKDTITLLNNWQTEIERADDFLGSFARASTGPTTYIENEGREFTQEEMIRSMGGDDEAVERSRRLLEKCGAPA